MSADERWSALLERLAVTGRLSVEEAARAFGVSPATIRRDFEELADQQLLVRTRGGAVPHRVALDLPAYSSAASASPSVWATWSTSGISSARVRKLTKQTRRQVMPSTVAGAR